MRRRVRDLFHCQRHRAIHTKALQGKLCAALACRERLLAASRGLDRCRRNHLGARLAHPTTETWSAVATSRNKFTWYACDRSRSTITSASSWPRLFWSSIRGTAVGETSGDASAAPALHRPG